MFDRLEVIAKNSYKNFHCKGLDYVCLARTPAFTLKAYFFDGNTAHLPEVVVPHNHRYDFGSVVLAGSVANRVYDTYEKWQFGSTGSKIYDTFDYLTPLLGGSGFEWTGEIKLCVNHQKSAIYKPGENYHSKHSDIHTIQILAPQSILLLVQYQDVVPVGVPTKAYKPRNNKEAPSLDGLYDEMTADDIIRRLEILEKLGYPCHAT